MALSILAMSLISFSVFQFCEAKPSKAETLIPRYNKDEIQVDASKHDLQFFNFVTRPDIDAPRWDIKMYNESALAPGYWFMSPYGVVDQADHDKAYVGPHIYDSYGQLIWSGVPTFDGYDAFDFKVTYVNGQDMLTAIHPHGNHSLILNNNYEVYADVDTGINKQTLNMHDFEVVDNGTKALYLTRRLKETSIENSRRVGFRGHCYVEFTGFEERDLATGEITFQWNPENKIDLDETTLRTRRIKNICTGDPWDYLHINSIDKLPDGDYLVSGRRSYALYKISRETGAILWRFGGKRSDFKFDGHFSGQHDARCLSQNSTHMVVTVMDNASGPGVPKKTNPNSRGLVMSLNTETMTAEVLKRFDHPKGEYAPARGNFQTLANGNGFLSWTSMALQSEHSPDGKVIMEAEIPSGLKTYRGYKFPWVGKPNYPPDVYSKVVPVDGSLITTVHVSWNGATEVVAWKLYKSNADGSSTEQVASTKRSGFETALTYKGYASYVIVKAIDKDGKEIGKSRMMQTRGLADKLHTAAIKEAQWLQEHSKVPVPSGGNDHAEAHDEAHEDAHEDEHDDHEEEEEEEEHSGLAHSLEDVASVFNRPIVAFFGGIVFCVAAALSAWAFWAARRKGKLSWQSKEQKYSELSDSDGELEREEFFDKDNQVIEEAERSDDDGKRSP